MTKERLLSIDVFRGLTVAFMVTVNTPGSWSYVYTPLLHAMWHGSTPTDMVFPFFIFAIGLSMAFSQSNRNITEPATLLKKVLFRSLLIFAVGFVLNWFPFYHKNILDVRLFGVLQRIAMSYCLAGIITVFFQSTKQLISVAVVLLLSYWALTGLFGDYTLEGNANNKIDQALIPLKNLYGGFGIKFDPEGLFGSVSSAAHIILGFLLGKQLFKTKNEPIQFLKKGLIFGVSLTVIGLVWSLYYPINKPLWTGSYVIYTSGIATLFLTALVYVTDYRKFIKWAFPFKVIGVNPLISFVLSIVIVKILIYVIKFDGNSAYGILYKQFYQPTFGDYNGSLLFALTNVLLVFGFAFFLYKKKVIIKL